jgi:glutamine phosphoribosylpyrophosphate amidotransferase
MLNEFDGSYSCLAATATELGFVKDAYALKPLLVAETDGFVALANEEIAIRAQFPGGYDVREANVKEVRVWQR